MQWPFCKAIATLTHSRHDLMLWSHLHYEGWFFFNSMVQLKQFIRLLQLVLDKSVADSQVIETSITRWVMLFGCIICASVLRKETWELNFRSEMANTPRFGTNKPLMFGVFAKKTTPRNHPAFSCSECSKDWKLWGHCHLITFLSKLDLGEATIRYTFPGQWSNSKVLSDSGRTEKQTQVLCCLWVWSCFSTWSTASWWRLISYT